MVVQSDGRLVVAGGNFGGDIRQFGVMRFNADGSLDQTFGQAGKATVSFGASVNQEAHTVALMPDGKIVVAGMADQLVAVARFNSDGTLDTTLKGTGKVTTDPGGGNSSIWAATVQPDGKILVGGNRLGSQGLDFLVIRYNDDGRPRWRLRLCRHHELQFPSVQQRMHLCHDGSTRWQDSDSG